MEIEIKAKDHTVQVKEKKEKAKRKKVDYPKNIETDNNGLFNFI